MIEKFEKEYMEKYWEVQTKQWNNYFGEGNYNLSEIDKKIYELANAFKEEIQPRDRRSKIAALLIKKDLVDKDPSVSEIRNRVDNFDNYNKGISEEVKQNRYQYRLALSYRMKEDVEKLIELRNSLAKKVGFHSYPELIFSTEEVDIHFLKHTLNDFLKRNLPIAKEIIQKYDMQWENWFSDLKKIGVTQLQYNPIELVEKLLDILGFQQAKEKVQIYFMEKGYSGCASALSPEDIRIVVEPIESLYNLKVLFHEVGHAISYSLNKEEGIYKILPPSFDEGMAVVIEYLAPLLLLSKSEKEKIMEMITLEYTRCAISALFEFDLWENPSKAEELYIHHYSKLGFEIKHPCMWAADTFRSIDPVYIYSYVTGAIIAEKLIPYLEEQYSFDYNKWGDWLMENIYKDGRKRPFFEKVKMLVRREK